jgi:hypothetical protein
MMNTKNINWGKMYSITGTLGVLGAFAIWAFTKASTYAVLPGQVADHERRITALESQAATNAVRLDDRLDRIDRDLKVIFRRLDAGGSAVNEVDARSAGSAMTTTNIISER